MSALKQTTDEFDVISQFMKGDGDTKALHFDEAIGVTTALLAQLKTALESGTKEEKKEILKKLKMLQAFMQLNYLKLKKSMNLSDEELKYVIEKFVVNSPTYRYKIDSARREIEAHKEGLKKFVKVKRPSSVRAKSKWIRS